MNDTADKTAKAAALMAAYAPLPGTVDEVLDAQGRVRGHWQPVIAGLDALGPQTRRQRWELARRLIRENGITYNIYGDPDGLARPWELDFMPLVIAREEWTGIEAGLKQRARLLDLVARDIYGPQRLIREGVLPAAVVLGNPHFLRPMHGAAVADGTFLHFYAADLGRGPDGRWWVLGDRAQAPSGAGYALENRIIMSRTLPELFSAQNVQRLAAFFARWRDYLVSLVRRPEARAVLLTPGPYNETYFEHVFLARYLGITLVEGADLTVRDDVLYLKTLEGLKRVDLVLRRVDAEFCDPLELRADSALGVPGLVRAVRAGNVAVANALGAGVLETEALHPFMPAIARHFGAGELILPEIATWWCGHADARAHVLAHLDQLAIRDTVRERQVMAPAAAGTAGRTLDEAARRDLALTLKLRGPAYVGQELVTLSSAPVFEGDQLAARPVSLRCYVAAVGDDYIVMPGGLTRFSSSRDPHAISMQRGDGSKDTWVLGDGPPSTLSLLPRADRAVPARRSAGDLPSRVADNLFWLGRYLERADATLRILRAGIQRMAEPEAHPGGGAALARLTALLHARSGLDPASVAGREPGAEGEPSAEMGPVDVLIARLNALLTDPGQPNGFPGSVNHLQRTALMVRDRLSPDMFRIITAFTTDIAPLSRAIAFDASPALAMVNHNLTIASALAGLQAENMTRGPGWLFMDMGKRIERARTLIFMLRTLVLAGDPESNGSLAVILELADSFMTYRTRYLAAPQLVPVLDLTVLDETNPRSIAYQVQALARATARIPRPGHQDGPGPDEKIVASLATALRMTVLEEACQAQNGRRPALEAVLNELDGGLAELSDVIARVYFAHAAPHRVFMAPRS